MVLLERLPIQPISAGSAINNTKDKVRLKGENTVSAKVIDSGRAATCASESPVQNVVVLSDFAQA